MHLLRLCAFFLIATHPLFVGCDDAVPQRFLLTAVNETTMQLDSIDTPPTSSFIFTVVGNRSTANCTFIGVSATKSDWLISSHCPGVTNEGSYYVNRTAFDFEFDDASQLVSPWTVNVVQRSRSLPGVNITGASMLPLPPMALERRWDFVLGRFVIDQQLMMDDQNVPLVSGMMAVSKRRRKKRNVLSDNELELSVIVDQCLWNQFLAAYGPNMTVAMNALNDYVDTIVSTANLMWNIDSIQPNLPIKVVNYQVWTQQPEEASITMGDDIENYLQSTCLLSKPNASGYDHSTVLSGCNYTRNGSLASGLAYTDQVCTAFSCSVINAGVGTGLDPGYTLAHEIGHAVDMRHDGDTKYAETSNCDPECCMMTQYGASSTTGYWSVCSKMRYNEKLVGMMVDDTNCLASLNAGMPPGEMPGQSKPDEAQCMDELGSCGRQYIGDISDCSKLYCTNTNGVTAIIFNMVRLDGSYCGPNKICESGVCVASSIPLAVVDGGWSAWNSNPEEICGGGNCSICTVTDQISARVEVRSCDNPYAMNGGAPCQGLNVRGFFCANCTDTGSLIDVGSYESDQCSADYPGSVANETASTDCTFVCSIDGIFRGRLWLPEGTLCSGDGRCINGQCLFALCADMTVYVGTVKDCPTDSPVDCSYSPWSTWSDCSTSCNTGSQTRSRTIVQEAQNGGAPCNQQLQNSQSCQVSTCPTPTTSTTRTTPTDCEYSDWGPWSGCSVSCSTGTQTRTRTVAQQSANGGSPCDQTSLTATAGCEIAACPNQSSCGFQLTASNVYGSNMGSTPRLVTTDNRAQCEQICLSQGVSSTSPCTAYLYSVNFCNLYSKIDGMIQQANLSINQLYEYMCTGDAPLNITLCNFYATQNNFVVQTTDSTINQGPVTGADMCHMQCLGRLAGSCVGLAYNSKTMSCIFYSTIPAAPLATSNSSSYTFYQSICTSTSVQPGNGNSTTTPSTPTMTTAKAGPATTPTSIGSATTTAPLATNGCPYVKTWSKVSEASVFSSQWKSVGAQASCANSCNALTDFPCKGYLSAGVGMECILFGTVSGQVLLHNLSVFDMYEPVCSGGSIDHTICFYDVNTTHVNMTAGPGIFGGYFAFADSCAELCIRNFGGQTCTAFTYRNNNGLCMLYSSIPTFRIDFASTTDLYAETCEVQEFLSQ